MPPAEAPSQQFGLLLFSPGANEAKGEENRLLPANRR